MGLTYYGYGVKGKFNILYELGEEIKDVKALKVSGNNLYVLYSHKVTRRNLATNSCMEIILPDECSPHHAAPTATGIIFTAPITHQLFTIENTELHVFAGDGREGHKDGIASKSRFRQLLRVSVKFGSGVYLTDAQSDCITISNISIALVVRKSPPLLPSITPDPFAAP